jgi:hypothetical protein
MPPICVGVSSLARRQISQIKLSTAPVFDLIGMIALKYRHPILPAQTRKSQIERGPINIEGFKPL